MALRARASKREALPLLSRVTPGCKGCQQVWAALAHSLRAQLHGPGGARTQRGWHLAWRVKQPHVAHLLRHR